MSNDFYTGIYNPDVLSCLANLSNDEVFTPPEVANQMLDMLPQELFSDPNTKFLDPACKSGVFLREIAKRLLVGLETTIPNLQERIDHIFHNQLYGIAITELTSLLSRRGVYCSKYPNSIYSVSQFDTAEGNIRYKRIKHRFKNGKCMFCGASQKEYDRGTELETHAYEFIHTTKPEEILNMKFDVIIGNPPYQLSDGGAQASASPLYNTFIEQCLKLNPRFLTMIIPARWYAGGKGLNQFRDMMLENQHIKELHDFPNTDDCFPGVNIRGGVCYFLYDKSFDATKTLSKVVTHNNDTLTSIERNLKYKDLDIFIRNGNALSILNKLAVFNEVSINEIISSRKPFGLTTDFIKTDKFASNKPKNNNFYYCYGKGKQVGYVATTEISTHCEWASKWKVMLPRANNIGTELNDDNQNAFSAPPNYICTESYLVVGADENFNEQQCINLINYMKTRFARFCHSLAKASQDATAKTYRFVPQQDFSESWTDEKLGSITNFVG